MRRDRGRETVAVDRERCPGRHLVGIGAGHDQRVHAPHFAVDEPDRIGFVVGAEGIRADEFGEPAGAMGCGLGERPHLMQDHGNAGRGDLPSRFAAGESAADDMNGQGVRHRREVSDIAGK